jgi:flagellar L-ring protein precursor FlgH
MTTKFGPLFACLFGAAQIFVAGSCLAQTGSAWGHASSSPATMQFAGGSLYSDSLAHSVGDLVTIEVTLQTQVTKDQETKTSKDTSVQGTIGSLVYPVSGSNKGWDFYTYHGMSPTTQWNSSQSFDGGGTINNQEAVTTTIEARVVDVGANGVLRVEAGRCSKAGEEDTSMVLTGLVRPEDLSSANSIASDRVADLQIIQKGKGTLSNNQRKGWLTKLYEFLQPF